MSDKTGKAKRGEPVEEEDRCLRCGTPYEPDATVCFTCGAPIGETRTPTQPVRKIPKPEPAASPATIPATVTPPATAARPSRPVAKPAEKTTEKAAAANVPARRSVPWPRVALVVALVMVALVGAGYLARALLAGPPVARATVYHDPQGRFHFQRPALWTVTPAADGVTLTDSAGVSTASVTTAQPADAKSDAKRDAKSEADAQAARLGLDTSGQQSFAGATWEERSGQVTGADGATRRIEVYVTLHAGVVYIIECSSPLSSFDQTDNLVYQPLRASFTFDQ